MIPRADLKLLAYGFLAAAVTLAALLVTNGVVAGLAAVSTGEIVL